LISVYSVFSQFIFLVFVGDGYTASQRDLFLEDMKRLYQEMFEGVTFRSFPLFNVWAVFRASVESGIGKNDKPKVHCQHHFLSNLLEHCIQMLQRWKYFESCLL
jgi:hypothetical protein